MVQMTLHLTRSSRPWTFPLLGFEVFQIRLQKRHFNGFYRDTHRRDFRPFEDKHIFHTFSVLQKSLRTHHELIRAFDIQGDSEISLEK
jgi:hypothetical protein